MMGSRLIHTSMESVGVPEDVSTTKPKMERSKAASPTTEFKLVNGIKMTLIDCGMTQGLLLLLLLGLFTLATTCMNIFHGLFILIPKKIFWHGLDLENIF